MSSIPMAEQYRTEPPVRIAISPEIHQRWQAARRHFAAHEYGIPVSDVTNAHLIASAPAFAESWAAKNYCSAEAMLPKEDARDHTNVHHLVAAS